MGLKIFFTVLCTLLSALAFETNDTVLISVNRVSPYANPTEAYK